MECCQTRIPSHSNKSQVLFKPPSSKYPIVREATRLSPLQMTSEPTNLSRTPLGHPVGLPRRRSTKQIRGERTPLPVAPQGEGVVAEPGLSAAGGGLVVAVTLVETTRALASGSKATSLAVLVDGVDDPVDAGVDADGLVLGVDKDDLVVLVGRVLVDPVGVEDAQVSAAAANTLLSGGTERALVLELVDTLVGGLAVGGTLGSGLLAATAADTDAVDNVALLGLVAETAGLVGARGAAGTVDDVQLAQLKRDIC